MSYGLPAFKVGGKAIAGFAAFKHHLSYLPHSGSVFPEAGGRTHGITVPTGALRFEVDRALPAPLVQKLVEVRLRQAFPGLMRSSVSQTLSNEKLAPIVLVILDG